jgi:hypothetical protein
MLKIESRSRARHRQVVRASAIGHCGIDQQDAGRSLLTNFIPARL